MTHAFHKFWLKITAIAVGSFAPVSFLGAMPDTAEPARLTLDLMSWPLDGAPDFEAYGTRLTSALAGGFLLGWGIMIWCLSQWVYDLAPEGVRRSVLFGVCAWFLLDGAGSIASGTASNVLFNLGFLIIGIGPLWWPARGEVPAE